MKPYFLLFALLPIFANAQRVVTFDPAKDPVARRSADGSIQIIVPARVLVVSILEAIPQMMEIQIIGIQKIGKSNYLFAGGKERSRTDFNFSVAILLAETVPGEFQADDLVISCSSAGDCRECSLPPICSCGKGEGSCSQNSAMIAALKKVTMTLFD